MITSDQKLQQLLKQARDALSAADSHLDSAPYTKSLSLSCISAIDDYLDEQKVEEQSISDWEPGDWYKVKDVDDMQRFFLSRLTAIREAAREHGYAIGVHGSQRRDFDLIAAPWCDDAADADTLARAIAIAACGITRECAYSFEKKPLGRLAVSIPICWTDRYGVLSDGCIDLSVMPAASQPLKPNRITDETMQALWDSSCLNDDRVLVFGRSVADEVLNNFT